MVSFIAFTTSCTIALPSYRCSIFLTSLLMVGNDGFRFLTRGDERCTQAGTGLSTLPARLLCIMGATKLSHQ